MVRVRFNCTCETLYRINQSLTDAQRERIEKTSFKFFLDMPEKLNIHIRLLQKMLAQWDEQSGGFRVRSRVVSFTPLDICFGLGLRIVGERVNFEDEDFRKESHTRNLFHQRDLSIKEVKKLLVEYQGEDSLADFCRIYILIGLGEFLMPRTRHGIDLAFFRFVDELDSIDEYAWGSVVYDYLVSSLTRAASRVHDSQNSAQVHITGCVALLQMWACEHLSLYDTLQHGPYDLIPRVRNVLTISLSKKEIEQAFDHNMVIEDLVPTSPEVNVAAIQEGIQEAQYGFCHWAETSYDRDEIVIEHRRLKEENAELRDQVYELQSRVLFLEDQLRAIKQHIGETNGKVTPPQPSPVENLNEDNVQSSPIGEVHADDQTLEASLVNESANLNPSPEPMEVSNKEAVTGITNVTPVASTTEVQSVMESPIPPPVPLGTDAVGVDKDVTSVEPVTGIPIATPVTSTTEVHPVMETRIPTPVQLATDAVGVNNEVILEGGVGDEHPEPGSTIATRLRNMPRKREPSVTIKTPFTTGKAYGRKRKR